MIPCGAGLHLGYNIMKLPVDRVLEVCCAAFRQTGGFSLNNAKNLGHIVKNTLDLGNYHDSPECMVTDQDVAMAHEIKDYITKRLTFKVLSTPDNYITFDLSSPLDIDYERRVLCILTEDFVLSTKLKSLIDLPRYYIKFKAYTDLNKKIRSIEPGVIGEVDDYMIDEECEIFHTMKCKNFEGYNVSGIIDNKLVSWYSKLDISPGRYIISRATIKELSLHYYAGVQNTRLSRVKLGESYASY